MGAKSLEIDIYKDGPSIGRAAKWDWSVCRKGGPPLKSGSVTGARQKAVEAAERAKIKLLEGRSKSKMRPKKKKAK